MVLSPSSLRTPRGVVAGVFSSCRNLLLVVAVLLSWWGSDPAATTVDGSSAAGSGGTGPAGAFPLAGIGPDPFVGVSPLVVGVVCRDGVLLMAVHTIFSEDSNEAEWSLMLRESDDRGAAVAEGNESNDSETVKLVDGDDDEEEEEGVGTKGTTTTRADIDLPRGYRGPFRIHSLGAGAGALVCAGFRTDGAILADRLRSFARSDERVFGIPANGGALADRAAAVLSRQAVSEGRRTLSCAGLLATDGRLYAVDATGAYAVRAHALGKGSRDLHRTVLCRTDWSRLDRRAVQARLLRSLGLLSPDDETSDEGGSDDDDEQTATTTTTTTNFLSKGSRIEMAIVEPSSAATDRNDRQERHEEQQRKTVRRLFASRI